MTKYEQAQLMMTTLAQDDLLQDAGVLRALAEHNRLRVSGVGNSPCAGVYAVIANGGTIRTGDRVTLH